MKLSIEQMFEAGKARGLETVSDAYDIYMNYYYMFFSMSYINNQVKEFEDSLRLAGLVVDNQIIDMKIDDYES